MQPLLELIGEFKVKYESKIGEVLEEISTAIVESETFADTPIFYDFIEVDANNLPPSCIVYKPLEWESGRDGCSYERELDIVLLITTEERRDGIIGQLFMFSEQLKEIIDEVIMRTNHDLSFVQGSPVQGFQYNRKGQDSYKETAQLFTSMVVLRYLLRY